MKYLLSNGTETTNYEDYIFDKLKIRLQLAKDSIPWYEHGVDSDVLSLDKKIIESVITIRVNQVVQSINREENVNLIVGDISIGIDNSYNLTIKLGNNESEINSRYR